MSEKLSYHGSDLVMAEVMRLNEVVAGVADLFNGLKREDKEGWGKIAGLAHWESKTNPSNGENFQLLVLTKN